MRILKWTSLLIFIPCICSCYRIALSHVGALENSVTTKKIANAEKQVAFIPMHHIGKRTFYNDVKIKIDSLKRLGFIVYYEGVKPDNGLDSLTSDTLAMKIRKAIGIDVRQIRAQKGYIDTASSSFMGKKKKFVRKLKLVNQPPLNVYFDTITDLRVDVTLTQLVAGLELKTGLLKLDSCDFKTRSDQQYSCGVPKRRERRTVMMAIRDSVVAETILREKRDKICVVYGGAHFDGIYKYLTTKDASWTRKN